MITFNIGGLRIQFTFLFFAVLTMILLTDQSGIAFWAFSASLMHELGHIIAFILFQNKPRLLSFELSGIRLVKNQNGVAMWKELVILSAGCIVNFSTMALTMKTNPLIAAVHLCLGVFNLLPIYTLDGGKIISTIATHVFSYQFAQRCCHIISYLVVGGLLVFSIYLCTMHNFTLLITSVYLLIMLIMER